MALRETTTQLLVQPTSCLRLLTPTPLQAGIHSVQACSIHPGGWERVTNDFSFTFQKIDITKGLVLVEWVRVIENFPMGLQSETSFRNCMMIPKACISLIAIGK